jgi:glycosyltransferase involved in cell wall biosynthesis
MLRDDGGNSGPLVSVCVITYNHERYIRQTLDGILMQETTFKYEVIVGEDCSPDNTREILLEYKEKHPETIHLILHEENVGMNKNAEAVWRRCRGKYLAYCEGDDYWTDPLKLQKQIDFLEGHPDHSGICHRHMVEYADGSVVSMPDRLATSDYTIEHYMKGLLPGQTATVVHRNFISADPELAEVFYGCCDTPGDMKLALWMTSMGTVHRLREEMSVYRFMATSTSASAAKHKKNTAIFQYAMASDLEKLSKAIYGKELNFEKWHAKAWELALVFFIRKPCGENARVIKTLSSSYDRKSRYRYLIKAPWVLLQHIAQKLRIEANKLRAKNVSY